MDKGYKCEHCDKHFPTKSDLHSHMRKAHKGNEQHKVEHKTAHKKKGIPKIAFWVGGIVILVIIALVLLKIFLGNIAVVPPVNTGNLPESQGIIVLNDKRCAECATSGLISQLKGIFPKQTIKEIDYNDALGKKVFEDSNLTYLPAIMFTDDIKTDANYGQVQKYLIQAGKYVNLRIGAAWDPLAEICDNGIDDNGDGLIDCKDTTVCAGQYYCKTSDKPIVELFVMSHCPFGLESEKGALPAVKLLGDKIDFKVRFIDYAMHGEKEVKEQWAQFCIQKDQPGKFLDYLNCFMEAGDSAGCLTKAAIDTTKLETCKTAVDTEFKVLENLNNKTLWSKDRDGKPLYAKFLINLAECNKYDIHGSPGLAINSIPVDSFARNPAAMLRTICKAFTVKPAECSQTLSAAAQSPGFGYNAATSDTSDAQCG